MRKKERNRRKIKRKREKQKKKERRKNVIRQSKEVKENNKRSSFMPLLLIVGNLTASRNNFIYLCACICIF